MADSWNKSPTVSVNNTPAAGQFVVGCTSHSASTPWRRAPTAPIATAAKATALRLGSLSTSSVAFL